MKKKVEYFKNRKLKGCGCGGQKFRTIIKDKAYVCVKCNTVKVVVDVKELTKYDQAKITDFNLQKQRDKETKFVVLKEQVKKAEQKKVRKRKPKRKFWTPKFLKKKQPNVVVSDMSRAHIKTERTTEKK